LLKNKIKKIHNNSGKWHNSEKNQKIPEKSSIYTKKFWKIFDLRAPLSLPDLGGGVWTYMGDTYPFRARRKLKKIKDHEAKQSQNLKKIKHQLSKFEKNKRLNSLFRNQNLKKIKDQNLVFLKGGVFVYNWMVGQNLL